MRRLTATILTCFLLGACSGGSDGDAAQAADTLTRGQKDTIISNLPIPGAGGVGRALDAVERTQDRARRHDSIGG